MKSLNSLSRNVATMVVALLFFVGANLANAQNYVAPQFKTVTVNGGVTGKCSVQIKYQRIANDSNNAAFQKINRANRVDVINQRAATTSDDIAVQEEKIRRGGVDLSRQGTIFIDLHMNVVEN